MVFSFCRSCTTPFSNNRQKGAAHQPLCTADLTDPTSCLGIDLSHHCLRGGELGLKVALLHNHLAQLPLHTSRVVLQTPQTALHFARGLLEVFLHVAEVVDEELLRIVVVQLELSCVLDVDRTLQLADVALQGNTKSADVGSKCFDDVSS